MKQTPANDWRFAMKRNCRFQNHGSHPLKASAQRPTLAAKNALRLEVACG